MLWLLTLACLTADPAPRVQVRDDASLRAAVRNARPGVRIQILPGRYQPGVYLSRVCGTADQPIVIEGADPDQPPLFEGGSQGWHLSDCQYVTLRNLAVRGQRTNGINVDDGGSYETPRGGSCWSGSAFRTWDRRATSTPSSSRAWTTSWSATARSRAGAGRPWTWSAAIAA